MIFRQVKLACLARPAHFFNASSGVVRSLCDAVFPILEIHSPSGCCQDNLVASLVLRLNTIGGRELILTSLSTA